jgi:glutamate dehydrogenase (NADP+)
MVSVHEQCVKYGTKNDGSVNYVDGANRAAAMKVFDAMIAQGMV